MKWSIWRLLATIAASVLVHFAPAKADDRLPPQVSGAERPADIALFADVLKTISAEYVAPVDRDRLTDVALKAMLGSLDGHSSYMNAAEYREFNENISGEFAGIGVVIEVADSGLRVITPTGSSPAVRAGVEPGWRIAAIAGESTQGMSLQHAVRTLRGEKGTNIQVRFIDRRGNPVDLTLTRETIHLQTVYSRRIGKFGYVRITSFGGRTDMEFTDAIAGLTKNEPIAGLIVDLRNNPGGIVDVAIAIAGALLEPGQVIVRQGRTLKEASASLAKQCYPALKRIPVVVLINGGTASAAEILASALHDNDRASIVGLTSFGKGIVQTVFPLSDGKQGAVTITTLRYFTPKGGSIQKIGVVPDLAVARTATEAQAALSSDETFSEASLNNAIDNGQGLTRQPTTAVEGPDQFAMGDSAAPPLFATPLPDDAAIKEDFQVLRALDILSTGSVDAARRLRPAQVYRVETQPVSGLTRE